MLGKHFLKAQLLVCCSARVSEKKKEGERDGGHSVDKAVLFLIYVLL